MKIQRGVIASKIRLHKALHDSGLNSQAALAERIADLEGLESAPKDLVSRVFREVRVDPRSIERIAHALGVDAFELYKPGQETESSDTPEHDAVGAEEHPGIPAGTAPAQTGATAGRRIALAAGLFTIAIVTSVALWSWQQRAGSRDPQADASGAEAARGIALTVLVPPNDAVLADFAAAARTALGKAFQVPSSGASVAFGTMIPALALETLNLDYVLYAEATEIGRRKAIRVTLHEAAASREIWADTFVRPWNTSQHAAFAADLTAATRAATTGSAALPSFPTVRAQRDYLQGMAAIDESRTEISVKRALALMQSALRETGAYPKARAGICRGLYEQRMLGNEVRLLEQAETECTQALDEMPTLAEAAFSLGQVRRKQGQLEEAERLYLQAIATNPEHVDAHLGLAEAKARQYLSTTDATAGEAAVAYASAAAKLDPGYWKAHFTLARMLYFNGDPHAAIAAYEDARVIDANPLVLSNLGTMHFCQGDYAQALEHYLTVKDISPDMFVGDGQLGVVYLYRGDYPRAVEFLRNSVETMAAGGEVGQHRLWGNYADALRLAGDREAALDAYEKAAALAERGYAAAPDDPNRLGFLGGYYAEIAVLDAENQTPRVREVALEQLARSGGATEMDAVARAAQGWVRLGRPDEARAALAILKGQCDGAWGSPDYASLRGPANDSPPPDTSQP